MNSRDLYERALETAPGGVHSPVRAFHGVGGTPVFFRSGHGARLTDVSDASYIDFCMSFGPLILGHRDPVVAEAVHEAVDRGWSFGAAEPYSLALAEWILAHVPWVERLRFVSSGTEAVMSAIRVARAATGRTQVLKFEGCYHGHADGLLVQAGSGLAGPAAASSAGIPPGTLAHTLVAPLDDEAAVDDAFAAAAGDLAAVVVEPVPANYGLLPQRREWLEHLADRCRRAGTLLIFDEVITGFRSSLEGAAGALGLRPDLVCYGKVIGGGFPVAAYGGHRELMDLVAPVGPVYQAGTLSANPVGMRAGLATLEAMADRDGWRTLESRAGSFGAALTDRLSQADVLLEVVQHASIFWIRRRADGPVRRPDRIPHDHAAWYRRFFHAALAQGIYLPPSAYEVCFLSLAHDDLTLALAAEALGEAARHLELA
jgi:glutamate-1-semialdehyde 2,1-aminomutase